MVVLGLLAGCATSGGATTNAGGSNSSAVAGPQWSGRVFTEPVTSLRFPEGLGDLVRRRIKGRATEPLGVLIRYTGAPRTLVDFFIYPAGGNGLVRDGIEDPVVAEAFGNALAAVKAMEQRGVYANAQLKQKGPVTLSSGMAFLKATMRYSLKGQRLQSALYVRGVGGYVVKIRVTFKIAGATAGERHAQQIEQAVPQIFRQARRGGAVVMMLAPRRAPGGADELRL